jgi:hypothetical protein
VSNFAHKVELKKLASFLLAVAATVRAMIIGVNSFEN